MGEGDFMYHSIKIKGSSEASLRLGAYALMYHRAHWIVDNGAVLK